MRIAILDPAAGISGDMTLAALVSLGLPVSWLEELPARLGVGDVRVTVRDVRRSGITCKQVELAIPPQPHGRHVGELVRPHQLTHVASMRLRRDGELDLLARNTGPTHVSNRN